MKAKNIKKTIITDDNTTTISLQTNIKENDSIAFCDEQLLLSSEDDKYYVRVFKDLLRKDSYEVKLCNYLLDEASYNKFLNLIHSNDFLCDDELLKTVVKHLNRSIYYKKYSDYVSCFGNDEKGSIYLWYDGESYIKSVYSPLCVNECMNELKQCSYQAHMLPEISDIFSDELIHNNSTFQLLLNNK